MISDLPLPTIDQKHAEMARFLNDLNEKTLGAYHLRRSLLKEHYGIEQSILAGGYGYRQILELIQNGADAIFEASEGGCETGGRIEVVLSGDHLYVANTGAALSIEGIDALLTSHNSPKRGNQIGRFGLGFKSLLRLGGVIDVFSSTWGGIRFDPMQCRNEIVERFGADEAPALRLAWSLPPEVRSADLQLKALDWAETVVRIKIEDPKLEAPLKAEVLDFPAEFLLFTLIPISLSLDVGDSNPRILSVAGTGAIRQLIEGEKHSEWRLFHRMVSMKDQEARSDATHIHARDEVPLTWAVPINGRRDEAGRFWAFFPTKTSSYISGILNAPWKLNNDRQGLIAGAWNEVLMKEAARLVVESLPSLSEPEDPASHLDSFPRRPDRVDVPAMPLLGSIWSGLEKAEIIPDCNGKLRSPLDLLSHPSDKQQLLSRWMALADEETRAEFIHPSCLRRERKARLQVLSDRLIEEHGDAHPCCTGTDWREWVTMVRSSNVELAKNVLKLARDIQGDCNPKEWQELRAKLEIVVDNQGALRLPADVIIGSAEGLPPGAYAIAPALLEDPDTLQILREVMSIAELGDGVWIDRLQRALDTASAWRAENSRWIDFWRLLLRAPRSVGLKFSTDRKESIKIADRFENWKSVLELLIPGRLVAEDDGQNQEVLIHPELHGETHQYLHALGATDLPEGSIFIRRDWSYDQKLEQSFFSWLHGARRLYRNSYQNSARPSYLYPEGLQLPNGWHFLSQLEGGSAAKLTRLVLERIIDPNFPESLTFGHCTQDYPTINVGHPLLWWVLKWGVFEIGAQTVTLRVVIEESENGWYGNIVELKTHQAAFQTLRSSLEGIETSDEERQEFWMAIISKFMTTEIIQMSWASLVWNGAADAEVCPTCLPGKDGLVPLEKVFVTTSGELAVRARSENQLAFVLSPTAIELWTSKGAQRLDAHLVPAWDEAIPGVRFLEAFPEFFPFLSESMVEEGQAIRATGLRLQFNSVSSPISCLLQATVFYFDGAALDSLTLRDRYTTILTELESSGALNCNKVGALAQIVDAQEERRRQSIAIIDSLEAKVIALVGDKPTPLFGVLGELGQQPFIRKCSLGDLARVALRHLGPTILFALKNTLVLEGFSIPDRWGTMESKDFAKSLGFPESFGAAQSTKRQPEEWSQGPFPLPPLHDFQIEVRDGIKALVDRQSTGRRGVVSLPTGGGKTRVTVETAVELILKPESSRRGVLWIAQTDELCEQAVQSFNQVWPNRGAERTGLRIMRLWGGNPTPSIPEEGEPFVVVASIQTFDARGGLQGDLWDRRLGMLVVDECHHAITPSYTRLFKWFGLDARSSEEASNSGMVILGLSATPFRMDDDESKRLAARFAKRWFPEEQEALYQRLLQQNVLCRVESEELPSGAGLSSTEERELEKLGELDGFEFERLLEKINQRLGDHEERNKLLVERIQRANEKSILLFANSVSHSNEMAARLNLANIPAAAVSGGTSRTARRYFLDQFQKGEIRVLCNHSVLTTGFDAPKTDMLLIARQVFSPVRYMQMVGRGLRGVKNGGTELCRIITVLDNLGRFQNRHPYYYCRQYFENYQA